MSSDSKSVSSDYDNTSYSDDDENLYAGEVFEPEDTDVQPTQGGWISQSSKGSFDFEFVEQGDKVSILFELEIGPDTFLTMRKPNSGEQAKAYVKFMRGELNPLYFEIDLDEEFLNMNIGLEDMQVSGREHSAYLGRIRELQDKLREITELYRIKFEEAKQAGTLSQLQDRYKGQINELTKQLDNLKNEKMKEEGEGEREREIAEQIAEDQLNNSIEEATSASNNTESTDFYLHDDTSDLILYNVKRNVENNKTLLSKILSLNEESMKHPFNPESKMLGGNIPVNKESVLKAAYNLLNYFVKLIRNKGILKLMNYSTSEYSNVNNLLYFNGSSNSNETQRLFLSEKFKSYLNSTSYNTICKKNNDRKIRADQVAYHVFINISNMTKDTFIEDVLTDSDNEIIIFALNSLMLRMNTLNDTLTPSLVSKIKALKTNDKKDDAINGILTFVRLRTGKNANKNPRFEAEISDNKFLNFKMKSYPKIDIKSENYDQEFNFGPFTEVYPATLSGQYYSNKQIAGTSGKTTKFKTELIDKLIKGDPVCVIAYGPSGSGKTSTLVYLETPDGKEKEDGLLLEIANHMINQGYKKCSITSHELNAKDDKHADEYVDTKPSIIFEPLNQDIIDKLKIFTDLNISDDIKTALKTTVHENAETPTVQNANIESKQEILKLMENKKDLEWYSITGFKHIKDEIKQMLEDRKTFGTPNNPQSSRSHLILEIKFFENDDTTNKKDANMMLCDFAGVENKFNCDDKTNTIEQFKNIETYKPTIVAANRIYENEYVQYKDLLEKNKKTQDDKYQFALNEVENKIINLINTYIEEQLLIINKDTYNVRYDFPQIKEINIVSECLKKIFDTEGKQKISDYVNHIIPNIKNITGDDDTKVTNIRELLGTRFNEKMNNAKTYKKHGSSIQYEIFDELTKIFEKIKNPYGLLPPQTTEIKVVREEYKQPAINIINNWEVPTANVENTLKTFNKILTGSILKFHDKKNSGDNMGTITLGNEINKQALFVMNVIENKTVTITDITDEKIISYTLEYLLLKEGFIPQILEDANDKYISKFKTSHFYENVVNYVMSKKSGEILDIINNYDVSNMENPKPPSEPNLNEIFTKICNDRVHEGEFINKSISEMQQFIGKIIEKKYSSFKYPDFIDKCIKYQCDESFLKCFGINDYSPEENCDEVSCKNISTGIISKTILDISNKSGLSEEKIINRLIICVFTVINMAEPRPEEPPLKPYINVVKLQVLKSKLEYYENIYDEILHKEIMGEIITGLNGEVQYLNKHVLLNNDKNDQFRIDSLTISKIKGHLNKLSDVLSNQNTNKTSINQILLYVNRTLDSISKINSITVPGALQFTDSIAKFGLNENVCMNADINTEKYANDKYEPVPKQQYKISYETASDIRKNVDTRDSKSDSSDKKRSSKQSKSVVNAKETELPFSPITNDAFLNKLSKNYNDDKYKELFDMNTTINTAIKYNYGFLKYDNTLYAYGKGTQKNFFFDGENLYSTTNTDTLFDIVQRQQKK